MAVIAYYSTNHSSENLTIQLNYATIQGNCLNCDFYDFFDWDDSETEMIYLIVF